MSTGFPVPAQKVASPALIHASAVLEPQDLKVLNMPLFLGGIKRHKGHVPTIVEPGGRRSSTQSAARLVVYPKVSGGGGGGVVVVVVPQCWSVVTRGTQEKEPGAG